MKYTIFLSAACALLSSQTSAAVISEHEQVAALKFLARAYAANAPHGYTPQTTSCPPSTPTIRSAASLSPQELSWLPVRRNATLGPMRDLLARMNITGLDTTQYINNHQNNASALPNIGIAVSGGGYRAMLNGAGVLEAFDSRTTNSTAAGQLGGLLQSTTYLSALSGGSWLVGSLFANNFTSIDQILTQDTSATANTGDLWQLDQTIFEGPATSGIQLLNTAGYYADLVSAVQGKNDAGFNTTITDYWGRALSYQLVNASQGGPAYTFSSVAQQEFFTNGSVPLPLIVSDNRSPGQKIVSGNSTVFTFNPWELGSEDPTVYAFAPLEYVGTNFTSGSPANTDQCVVGFDNIGFVMGTSSSLFNSFLTAVNSSSNQTGLFTSVLKDALEAILEDIGNDNDDIADYPNPFYQYRNGGLNVDNNTEMLTLVDGGEDGQNIPLHPLIQPYRHVDVVFAIDSSADTTADSPSAGSGASWPAGISLIATYNRSTTPISNGTVFPRVPDTNTFINLGLAEHPTFFGCDPGALSGPSPLIVYLPNNPYIYWSNTSTFDLQYNDTERNVIIQNAYDMATQGNSTLDSKWPTCVGCAILSRSLNRTGTPVPQDCQQCFQRYCWNGTTDSSTPKPYNPPLRFQEFKFTSGVSRVSAQVAMSIVGAAVASLTLL